MAYSRWTDSFWFTLWAAPKEPIKENNQFHIMDVKVFTYKQITEDIDQCISIVRSKCSVINFSKKPVENDFIELKGLMQEFIKDVNEEFV